MKFQLVVQNNTIGENHGADSCVIDLKAKDMEDARREAARILYGDPSKWTAEWVTTYDGVDRIQVDLDPKQDTFHPYKHHPILATNKEGDNWVKKASIVQVMEDVRLAPLRSEIRNAFE